MIWVLQITSLMDRLGLEWPNLNGDNRWFWGHEWSKHGMCSADWLTAYSYFRTTLDLKNSVDLLQFMAEANITPSQVNLYNANDIFEAIRKKTGHKPRLWCYDCYNGTMILLEISICVQYSMQYSWDFIDCPQTLLNYMSKNCYGYGTGPVVLLLSPPEPINTQGHVNGSGKVPVNNTFLYILFYFFFWVSFFPFSNLIFFWQFFSNFILSLAILLIIFVFFINTTHFNVAYGTRIYITPGIQIPRRNHILKNVVIFMFDFIGDVRW